MAPLAMHEFWTNSIKTGNYDDALQAYAFYRQALVARHRQDSAGPLEDEDMAPRAPLANNFLVGTDPEFVVLTGNKLVNVKSHMTAQGLVGWDHSGDVLEVRPEPTKGTFALCKKIQALLQEHKGLTELRNYKWRAGAYVTSEPRHITLGGHVHFDVPPPEHPDGDQEEHFSIVQACDRVVRLLEDLDILPKAESHRRRTDPTAVRHGYGKFGDWRPSGPNHERFEYRTPASWLFDPKVAYITLTALKLAAVAPDVALDKLPRAGGGWNNLQGFLEVYRHKDTNARRALERLIEGHSVKGLQVAPDVDFRQRWERLGI